MKKISCVSVLLLVVCSSYASVIRPFITQWKMDSANEQMYIPIVSGVHYNYNINWGDGSSKKGCMTVKRHIYPKHLKTPDFNGMSLAECKSTSSRNSGAIAPSCKPDSAQTHYVKPSASSSALGMDNACWMHTYSQPGSYTVTITPVNLHGFPAIEFYQFEQRVPSPNVKKIMNVVQWGDGIWKTMYSAFFACTNLDVTATDVPNLSQVSSLQYMFHQAKSLKGNASFEHWNTASVTNMGGMFYGAQMFDQNIGSWDTSHVTDMSNMFGGATIFNQNIGDWNTSNVTNMNNMFNSSSLFNQNIGGWDTAKVTDMNSMFDGADVFNQNIGGWNTANVLDMSNMFSSTKMFNQDIGSWNTVHVTDMSGMFSAADAFNQDIGSWNTKNVKDMSWMFFAAGAFNQNIGKWNTTNVKNMRYMFSSAKMFNQDIGSWNTANVGDMSGMFARALVFNQPIGKWDTSNVKGMSNMFAGGKAKNSFNQNIMGWNTAHVTDMSNMFGNATSFNQDLGGWNIKRLNNASGMLVRSGLTIENYGKLLVGWAKQHVLKYVPFGVGNTAYPSSALMAHDKLEKTDHWNITDKGMGFDTLR